MATRTKAWKRTAGWLLMVTFSLAVTLGQAETGYSEPGYSNSSSDEPTEITAPQDLHVSTHVLFKVKYADWTGAETVQDLPHIILRNSLLVWSTDYRRNPFYRLTNINAP